MMSGRSSFLFTASQWQELEHQALIFKYMVAGIPIPSDLLFTIKTSLDSSLSSSNRLLHQPQPIGWKCLQMGMGMGFGRKIDPEPGRCRRTDGKKWRCSKEAYPDSKYCERHMHRGRNRSRKPVDINTNSPISSSSITKNPTFPTRPPPVITLDTGPYFHTDKYYRRNTYGHGMKEEVDEHVFFSEASQTMRSSSSSTSVDDSWQLSMGSSLNHLQGLNDSPQQQKQDQHYYGSYGSDVKHETPPKIERDHDEPRKVMHHFFDVWPPRNKDSSWLDSDHRSSNQQPVSDTKLSISMPNYSQDFFTTQ